MDKQDRITNGFHFGAFTVTEDTGRRKNRYKLWKCTCECGNIVELSTKEIRQNRIMDCGCKTTVVKRYLELSGMRFGKLVALFPTDKRDVNRSVIWECQCDCGMMCQVSSGDLRSGYVKSCGCLHSPIIKDFIGKRFGYLCVVEYMGKMNGVHQWKCICDCGNETIVGQTLLQSGRTKSCGCLRAVMMQENLKLCEGTSVTLLKKRKMKTNTSGYTGVSFNKKTGRWIVKITFKGHTYYLGSFRNIDDAVQVRLRGEEMYDDFLEWYHREYEIKDKGVRTGTP